MTNREIAKTFEKLFAEIDLYHHGYDIPYNGVKKSRFFISPKEEKYLYIIELGADYFTKKLFFEASVGITSRKFSTNITVENLSDFNFEFVDEVVSEIDEDGSEYNIEYYYLKLFFKGECIFSLPIGETYSDDVF